MPADALGPGGAVNSSATASWTNSRSIEMQSWPALENSARSAPSTARSRSASSSTIIAFRQLHRRADQVAPGALGHGAPRRGAAREHSRAAPRRGAPWPSAPGAARRLFDGFGKLFEERLDRTIDTRCSPTPLDRAATRPRGGGRRVHAPPDQARVRRMKLSSPHSTTAPRWARSSHARSSTRSQRTSTTPSPRAGRPAHGEARPRPRPSGILLRADAAGADEHYTAPGRMKFGPVAHPCFRDTDEVITARQRLRLRAELLRSGRVRHGARARARDPAARAGTGQRQRGLRGRRGRRSTRRWAG